MDIKSELSRKAAEAVGGGVKAEEVHWEHPETEEFGDLSTNLVLVRKTGKPAAEKLAKIIAGDPNVDEATVAGPGFVNVRLKDRVWVDTVAEVLQTQDDYGKSGKLAGVKIMVEYAHPNTHKEMHIGHMRTLITGEALVRVLEKNGAEMFRANYQGDIGPHVAKAIWGTEKLLKTRGISWEKAEKMSREEKAHLLGEGYVEGNKEYETNKDAIDKINTDLYDKKSDIMSIYQKTREWSLDYYKSFYDRFGTKFDRLFFESEVADRGKALVVKNLGRVFEESAGAIIFDGEKYGLHKRVFVTKEGNPTYEGKEMGLAYLQWETFPFDRCIHVVANEQTGYFEVVIKALEQMDNLFTGREYHLPMGMVNLVGRKMSSRTGEILTVDSLISEVKALAGEMIKKESVTDREIEEIAENVALAAIKYSVLKTNPELNVTFDLKQSVNLEGSSGPYLQYTYARCRSVIKKSGRSDLANGEAVIKPDPGFQPEERQVMKWLYRYPEVIEEAGIRLSPNLVGGYLQELAARYNTFYNQHSILSADNSSVKEFRLKLTAAVAQVLKNGINVLGMKTLERM